MKLIIILLLSIFLTGCEEKVYEDKTGENINVISDTFEVYSNIHLKDILDPINEVEILSNNNLIDTSSLGSKKIEVEYRLNKKKYSYKFNVNVVDSEAPIVFSGTTKTVTVGYDKDLCDLISYGDEYDGNIKCNITGDYNLNESGTYKLNYKLSDSSENIKEVTVTLKVVPKSTNNGGGNTQVTPPKKTEFTDVYKSKKSDNNEIGIDISKWQGDVDFEKVKNAGATFVMMRIGAQGEKKGDISIDQYYLNNIKKAKDAGLKVGVYLASRASSIKEAKEQANWVIKTLDKEKLDLPISFDWENWGTWNSYKISFHEINEIANAFMTEVKTNGYEAMLYSSKFYLETIWTNKLKFPVWLAHYTNSTSYEGDFIIWQLCNDGHIDSINGDVDIDVLYHE